MLRLVFIGVLLSLMCSCAPFYWASLRELEGEPVDGLIRAWGDPEYTIDNLYFWSRRETENVAGGYYTSYERMNNYDKNGKLIGYSEVPVEKYQAPYTNVYACSVRAQVDKQRLIEHISYDGKSEDCWRFFRSP